MKMHCLRSWPISRGKLPPACLEERCGMQTVVENVLPETFNAEPKSAIKTDAILADTVSGLCILEMCPWTWVMHSDTFAICHSLSACNQCSSCIAWEVTVRLQPFPPKDRSFNWVSKFSVTLFVTGIDVVQTLKHLHIYKTCSPSLSASETRKRLTFSWMSLTSIQFPCCN